MWCDRDPHGPPHTCPSSTRNPVMKSSHSPPKRDYAPKAGREFVAYHFMSVRESIEEVRLLLERSSRRERHRHLEGPPRTNTVAQPCANRQTRNTKESIKRH